VFSPEATSLDNLSAIYFYRPNPLGVGGFRFKAHMLLTGAAKAGLSLAEVLYLG